MAPKKGPTGEGIVATVIRKFQAGQLEISLESALNKVELCPRFGGKGLRCSADCKKIHYEKKKGKFHPSVGLNVACELARNPLSHPGVHVDPELALQAFLLAKKSPLIIDKMFKQENAFVFRFAEQPISSVVKAIARQKFVNINVDGVVRELNFSDEVAMPSLVLHGVKQDSLRASLEILVNGFKYGALAKPFGIYTVDATNEQQSGKICYYDKGVSIVLKPTGFIAKTSANDWVSGAIPGVVLFRRMKKLKEYIMHKDTVQFKYISMEQDLFEPWAREYAVSRPDDIRSALLKRSELKASAEAVLPSGPELSDRVDAAQTMAMASSEPWPSCALTVAQPRLRSRSRSPTASEVRPESGRGVEIEQPAVLAAKSPVAGTSKTGEQCRHEKAIQYPNRPRDPQKHPVPSEMDRRLIQFEPSTVVYVHLENEKMQGGALASSAGPSTGSSLSAARAVLRADCAESMAVAQEPKRYFCDGPECSTRMSGKDEWQRYHGFYYCHHCYDRLNFCGNPAASSGSAAAASSGARPCEGPGCSTRMIKGEWTRYCHRFYCKTCYDGWNMAK